MFGSQKRLGSLSDKNFDISVLDFSQIQTDVPSHLISGFTPSVPVAWYQSSPGVSYASERTSGASQGVLREDIRQHVQHVHRCLLVSIPEPVRQNRTELN